jgi:hypothetical protein
LHSGDDGSGLDLDRATTMLSQHPDYPVDHFGGWSRRDFRDPADQLRQR